MIGFLYPTRRSRGSRVPGGHWKFFAVTWNVAPYFTSEAAILAAQSAGDVTVTRVPAMDFLCPIQF